MNWYLAQPNCNLQHRNKPIPAGKKVWLTSEQVAIHNSFRGQVLDTSEPSDQREVGNKKDWDDWYAENIENWFYS